MKKPLLALAVLAIAGLLATLWFAFGSEAPRATATVNADAPREAAPTRAPSELAEIAAPSSPEPESRTTVEPDRAGSRAERLLADAQWVEVELEMPANVPLDEKIELVAIGFAPDRFPNEDAAREALSRRRQVLDNASWFGVSFKDDGEVEPDELTCERTSAGTYRAPFPAGSRVGLLQLRARYVFAKESVAVELPAQSARIPLELGAWLSVTLTLPTPLPSDIDAAALAPIDINAQGWSMGGGGNHGASATVKDTLACEFGGLRPALTYFLTGEPKEFARFGDMNLKFTPGQHVERSYALLLGGRFRGRVVGGAGEPIAGATVAAESIKRRMMDFGGPREAMTDENGAFDVRGVTPGKFKLHASAEARVGVESDEFDIADAQVIEGIELRLGDGGTLAGRVVLPDGSPATTARVRISENKSRSGDWGSNNRRATREVPVREDGTFAFTGVQPSPCSVVATLERDTTAPDGTAIKEELRARRDGVTAGTELVLQLAPSQLVRGRAVNDLGEPIALFTLKKTETSEQEGFGNPNSIEVINEPAGKFAISLPAGSWELSAESEGHAPSPAHKLAIPGAHEEIVLTLPRAIAISGRVFDPAGAPLAGAEVAMRRTERRVAWDRRGDETKSDAEGKFTLDSVAPGAVTLIAKHSQYAPSEELTVALEAGQPAADVELRVRIGGRLEGEVYDAAGEPDAGREIVVGNFGMGEANMGGNATSDATGRFVVERLPPGKFNVIATPRMDSLANGDEDIDQAAIMASLKMASVEIRDGETSHVLLGGRPKSPVQLSGKITAGGEPFTAGMLMVVAEGKSMLDSLKMVKIDPDGRYAVTLDGAGDYSFIVGSGMGDDHSAEFSETVPEVEQHVIDFAVPLGAIRGRVVSRDGAPLAEIPVSVSAEDRTSLLIVDMGRQIATDSDGRFEFQRLRPGTYTIRAGASRFDGFRSESKKHAVAVRGGVVVQADRVLEGVELRLDAPGVIEGRVVDSEGTPVARAAVFVRNSEGRVLNPVSTCTSDGLGKFTFDGAAPGSYTVSARSGQLASRDVGGVRVAADAKSEVELRLEPGTVLRVSVANEEDKLVRATLRIVDEDGREVSGLFGADALESLMMDGFSTTEQRVGPLAPGKYKVTAIPLDGDSVTKSVTLTGNEERFLRLKLKD